MIVAEDKKNVRPVRRLGRRHSAASQSKPLTSGLFHYHRLFPSCSAPRMRVELDIFALGFSRFGDRC
jgi:hypothetical protein